jgi:hypothetical protein
VKTQPERMRAWSVPFEGAPSWPRLALIAGMVGLGTVLILNVPGVAEVRRYRSLASVLSHATMLLIALGLSPRLRDWVERASALSGRRQALGLVGVLAGTMAVIVTGLLVAPSYGHELFTREWGLVEPAQFVLWLTAAWLALERARVAGRGTADQRAFRLAAGACGLLALEEVDYLGIVTLVARVAGAPDGRIGHHHIGGVHDLVNDLGKVSLVLGVLALVAIAGLVLAWAISQGLHRVVIREIFSRTSLPLLGTVVFLGIAQLADIDHPALNAFFAQYALVRRLREEPMELLAAICLNACLIAKLSRRGPSPIDRPRGQRPLGLSGRRSSHA